MHGSDHLIAHSSHPIRPENVFASDRLAVTIALWVGQSALGSFLWTDGRTDRPAD